MKKKIEYRNHTITIERDDDYETTIYDHPINNYGHGLWEQGPWQEGEHEEDDECDWRDQVWRWAAIFIDEFPSLKSGFDGDFIEGEAYESFPHDIYNIFGLMISKKEDGYRIVVQRYIDEYCLGFLAIKKKIPSHMKMGHSDVAFTLLMAGLLQAYLNNDFFRYDIKGDLVNTSATGFLIADNSDMDELMNKAMKQVDEYLDECASEEARIIDLLRKLLALDLEEPKMIPEPKRPHEVSSFDMAVKFERDLKDVRDKNKNMSNLFSFACMEERRIKQELAQLLPININIPFYVDGNKVLCRNGEFLEIKIS